MHVYCVALQPWIDEQEETADIRSSGAHERPKGLFDERWDSHCAAVRGGGGSCWPIELKSFACAQAGFRTVLYK